MIVQFLVGLQPTASARHRFARVAPAPRAKLEESWTRVARQSVPCCSQSQVPLVLQLIQRTSRMHYPTCCPLVRFSPKGASKMLRATGHVHLTRCLRTLRARLQSGAREGPWSGQGPCAHGKRMQCVTTDLNSGMAS